MFLRNFSLSFLFLVMSFSNFSIWAVMLFIQKVIGKSPLLYILKKNWAAILIISSVNYLIEFTYEIIKAFFLPGKALITNIISLIDTQLFRFFLELVLAFVFSFKEFALKNIVSIFKHVILNLEKTE